MCSLEFEKPLAEKSLTADQYRTRVRAESMYSIKDYEGKTVLVTGGAGAIGSNLTGALAAFCERVIVLDNLVSSTRRNLPNLSNVLFVEGDILDEIKVKRCFFERPQIIFHLAASFANQNSVDHPEEDLMVNGMGTLKLMEYSVLQGVDRFVFASSGCSVYGDNARLPLTEDKGASMYLRTPYQVTKMLGELYANFFPHHHSLPVSKARLFNSYGPGEVPGQYRNVIPNFIYWALHGRPLPITGSGEETRTFTWVGDVVDGLLRSGLHEAAIGQEFNLAGGWEISTRRLAEKINSLAGNKAGIQFVSRRKWDSKKRVSASVEKARKLIGYAPEADFDWGLAQTVQWFRDNWEWINATATFGPGISSAVREIRGQVDGIEEGFHGS